MTKSLKQGTVAIVCGRRTASHQERLLVRDTLDAMQPSAVIQGGADGFDRAAKDWAKWRGVACAQVDPDDTKWPSAGPTRNGHMLMLRPDVVIAFPGGYGTADMVRQAKQAGVRVICVDGKDVAQ